MQKILFIGGNGQMGRKMIDKFSQSYAVSNIDYSACMNAQKNFLMQKHQSVAENNKAIINKLMIENEQYKAIIVTAGGWVGGSIKDDDYFQKTKNMMNVCLYPSLLAAHLATKYLQEQGIIVFTGAAAVFKEPQPDMIAYSMAKTAVHSLALNLAEKAKQQNKRVITLLPQTVDTQSNRKAMPEANFDEWSKPEQIGELVKGWVDGLNVPNNGSFAILKVKKGCVNPEFV